MRRKTLLTLAVLVLGHASIAEAQTKDKENFRVSGRVTDKASGVPVPVAVIRFEDLRRAVAPTCHRHGHQATVPVRHDFAHVVGKPEFAGCNAREQARRVSAVHRRRTGCEARGIGRDDAVR